MKAITLWQPWASLLACGAKKYETRSWATTYRGPIAIHAALKRPPEQGYFNKDVFHAIKNALTMAYGAWRYDWYLGRTRINPDGSDNGFNMPLGEIIATAELIGCREIKQNPVDGVIHFLDNTDAAVCINEGGPSDELYFGDWTPGRYAWEFANMKILDEPIPAKGAQRLWSVPENLIEQINE